MARNIKHKGMTIAVKRAIENLEAERSLNEARIDFSFSFSEPSSEDFDSFFDYQLELMESSLNHGEILRQTFWYEFFENVDRYNYRRNMEN